MIRESGIISVDYSEKSFLLWIRLLIEQLIINTVKLIFDHLKQMMGLKQMKGNCIIDK